MRDWMRFVLSAFFYYMGVVSLARWLGRNSEHSLTILYYHRAGGENLRKQWLYLRRHYCILPLQEALEALQRPSEERNSRWDQRPLLALTFDDGYADNYTHAFALASELKIPITIFLIAAYIGCAHAFWWTDQLLNLAQVERFTFEGHSYNLDRQEERKTLAQSIDERMRSLATSVEREALLATLCSQLALSPNTKPVGKPVPLLDWDRVQEMDKSGWVSFGAHTLHHADLQQISNPKAVQREVEGCKRMLEQQLGHAIELFAYPHGHCGKYGLYAVKQAGYQWAFTIVPGRNTRQSNPYLLHRMNADADRHVLVVAAEVAGIWRFFSLMKKFARSLFHNDPHREVFLQMKG